MELLSYIAFFFLGYWLAGLIFAWRLKRAVKKIAKDHGIELELEEKPTVRTIPVLTTELVTDSILLYDTKNNFICQGQSLEEVADKLLKYKNIHLALIVHNDSKFWFVEGKVKEE